MNQNPTLQNRLMLLLLVASPAFAGCTGAPPSAARGLEPGFLEEDVTQSLRIEASCTNGFSAQGPGQSGPLHSTGGVFTRTTRVNGTIRWIDMNLTWTAASELNREYSLSIFPVPRNATAPFVGQGASPVRVRIENVSWPENVNAIRIDVRPVPRSAAGGSIVLAPTQPFLVEGSLGLRIRTSLTPPNQTAVG